jgi:membrane-anchored protein YejM (alkaline phosphatase superfamily)
MVIISADHGENLGEDDQYRHSFISEQTLHIPLIIKDNRYFKGGKNIFTAVSSVDIVPTVLNTVNRINYFFTKRMFQGINLSGLLKNDEGKRKYIYSYKPPLAIIRDVNKNLVLPSLDYEGYKRADQPAYLKQELIKWLKENPTPASLSPRRPDLDKDSLEALRNLGYMQ